MRLRVYAPMEDKKAEEEEHALEDFATWFHPRKQAIKYNMLVRSPYNQCIAVGAVGLSSSCKITLPLDLQSVQDVVLGRLNHSGYTTDPHFVRVMSAQDVQREVYRDLDQYEICVSVFR